MLTIGLVEGIAEATASMTKIFSGRLSDYLGKRKGILVFGYALSSLTKPIFPLATSIGWVFSARFIDRIGKGIRGAPRDALIADITLPEQRGSAYGLRQSIDSVGAILGPLVALGLMLYFSNNMRAVMGFAVLPALITVGLLILYIKEPEKKDNEFKPTLSIRSSDMKKLPSCYWSVVILGSVFTLARFSEAFLILRAQDFGLTLGYLPFVLVVMNIFYAGFAYPIGATADQANRRNLLLIGLLLLIVADLILAVATSLLHVFIGTAFWGLHMAFTQGLFSKLVADTAPKEFRGTAFGLFHLIGGVSLLLASAIAGALWSTFDASVTFYSGAFFAGVAFIGLMKYRAHDRTSDSSMERRTPV